MTNARTSVGSLPVWAGAEGSGSPRQAFVPTRPAGRWSALRVLVISMFASILAVAAAVASAQNSLYWDTNGTTAGSGPAGGTWGTDNFWNTDSTGGGGGSFQTSTTIADNLFISAGTNAAGTTRGLHFRRWHAGCQLDHVSE